MSSACPMLYLLSDSIWLGLVQSIAQPSSSWTVTRLLYLSVHGKSSDFNGRWTGIMMMNCSLRANWSHWQFDKWQST